ncbi:transcription factor bHLH155 isoform X1 [Cajanus cajan]|uniref:transcription factor bHLH155 isoform X1 n=1 Tax=Cajanus cajan TaxID=3821 RepID=UPI00098DA9AA|nr:transcription factor bHLH155 isoform X1 [Cajanus cajan]XP_020231515.1 transcription factor bHLH155 isoform X1 [Cajanus cajan]XP_020231516.1 transcription factor bHLH155 isoform X1 [Cajanus cajan]XP_020231517.1 transcription factor bHLH155 isoform X1 [Cajanus cajan]
MGSNLHRLLRSFCLGTDWKYAIFWKLKHRARIILTWEDAYYDNPNSCDSSENKSCQNTLEQIGSADFSHDPLGLAVAKMSYHVYSLGEGIVGQVAVTGKHRWICVDNQVSSSGPSFEFVDGWQSQFSAGIRTIVVVAVVPLGVVQLGSLNKQVIEDVGVVTCIRSLLLSTQDYIIGHVPNQVQNSEKHSSLLDTKTSESMPAYFYNTTKTMKCEAPDILMPSQFPGKNYSPHAVYQKMVVDVAKHEGPELNSEGNSFLLQSMSNMTNVENQKFVGMRPVNERKFEGKNSGCEDTSLESGKNVSSFSHNLIMDNNGVSDLVCPSENVRVDCVSFPSDFLDAAVCESDMSHYVDINQKEVLNVPGPSDANSQKNIDKSKFQTEPCYKDTSYTLKFPAGYELHEALGPSFLKGSKYFDWETETNQDKTAEISDDISCSQSTSESRPEHLLEAMVANICHSNNNVNSELSFSTSMQAAMASGRNPEGSIHTVHTINSDGCSMDESHLVREDKHHSLSSSGICGVISPKGFSSTCPSSCSEQFERSSEPTKNSKKRARPGESCRPRPRDRQLIQDRIKELRELVPNGAKCSIDSLLECTIKHMLFLQNITKHADKLNKFADTKTKLHHMEKDNLGSSSYQQGSSWAMEVGGHLKVRSILVENLNKNGQMLVEMLCEECSHFLEIAEAIRSLGLTILNGATEAHGEKTCICFVVEAGSEVQNNRNLHRLDILWPLVQLLQSKSTMYS